MVGDDNGQAPVLKRPMRFAGLMSRAQLPETANVL